MRDEQDDSAENTGKNTGAEQGCPENLKPYKWQNQASRNERNRSMEPVYLTDFNGKMSRTSC